LAAAADQVAQHRWEPLTPVDRVTLTGDVVLTKDKAGLALAKKLQALVGGVVKELEVDKELPDVVEVKEARTGRNTFA
jgi:hypothetical protein